MEIVAQQTTYVLDLYINKHEYEEVGKFSSQREVIVKIAELEKIADYLLSDYFVSVYIDNNLVDCISLDEFIATCVKMYN